MKFDTNTIAQWQEWKEGYHQDKEYFNYANEVRGNRQRVIGEIRTVFNNFLNGSISLEEFRSIFHHKTSTTWDYFGMKGLSGAMVLNKYVKHIPDQQALADNLRKALKCPRDAEEGRRKMEQLATFLESMMKKYKLKPFAIQPGRIPYFVSGFWHFQSSEEWPFYYRITRAIFERNGIYESTPNPIEDYFQFRNIFLTLKSDLHIDSFELDYLCGWLDERNTKKIPVEATPPQLDDIPPDEDEQESPEIDHNHVQWMLAKIGKNMGYKIWIASNDRSKKYQDEIIGSFSEKELPALGLGDDAQKIVRYIDVIWLEGSKRIAAAFEIEKSTSIYSGILRMSDLVAEAPNTNFPLYIIAPENRMKKIERQLSRPTFQALDLHERCKFFSDITLSNNFDHIMKLATHISTLDKLAKRIPSK